MVMSCLLLSMLILLFPFDVNVTTTPLRPFRVNNERDCNRTAVVPSISVAVVGPLSTTV